MGTPDATPCLESPPTWPAGWQVEVVAETGSTNADLLAAAERGAPDRTVLAARHQTAGRGRLDRRWEAPAGANLLVSMLFRAVPARPHELTQRVALAARAACVRLARVEPVLKWPNDLLLDDRKLAGVLAETAGAASGRCVVVGLGLNVGWSPEGAARLGDGLDPLDLLHELLVAFDELPTDVFPAYRDALGTLGRAVRVELTGGGELVGTALDVEPDGRLVVLDACGLTHRVDTGDVVHLRPA